MPGVDLGRAVIEAVELGLIAKGGGHAMAAGVTIKPGQLGPFRSFLASKLSVDVTAARAATALPIDAALTARGATLDLVHDLEKAGPYGSGNPTPGLCLSRPSRHLCADRRQGRPCQLHLTSEDGARLKAIAFRAASTAIGDACCATAIPLPFCRRPRSTTIRAASRFSSA